MAFKGSNVTIAELFSNDKSILIPPYQRDYSWERDNVEKFFSDIYESFEKKEEMYFIGSVILIEGKKNKEEKESSYQVIDGQQRMTTTFLFLKALKSYLQNLDNRSRYISAIDGVTHRLQTNDSKLKIETRQNAKKMPKGCKSFNEFMEKDELEKDQGNKYYDNYVQLKEKLEVISADGKEKLENLCSFFLHRVNVIKIECDNLANAIKIFDTINSTGVDLTGADIIKSKIMAKEEESEHENIDNMWCEIEEIAKKLTDKAKKMDIFLNNFYLYKFSLYDGTIIERFDKNNNFSINDLMDFAKKCKDIYDEKCCYLDALKYIKWDYWLCLVAAQDSSDQKKYKELKKNITKLFYSYFLAGRRSDAMSADIKSILDKKKSIKDAITENHIREIESLLSFDDLYNGYQKRVTAAFYLLECQKNDGTHILNAGQISLDHIFSKSKNSEKNIHSIGNLVLMSRSKNSSQGNKDDIKSKHESYIDSSFVYCRDSFDENFSIEKIEERKEKIKTDLIRFLKNQDKQFV